MKSRIKILDLRPTQFAVGMMEVDEKIKFARKFNKKQRRDYVEQNPVPVVLSPHNEFYIVDHHHFLCVCYHIGIRKVNIQIVKDLSKSKISYANFWKWMFKTRNAYPFCQFGEGPRKALYLPRDIRGLADDPYRSIAWFVRKAGGFENTDRNFAEFKWANFFRSRKLLDFHGLAGMPQALVRAVKLAQSPAAKSLPGFEKLRAAERDKVMTSARKKGAQLSKK